MGMKTCPACHESKDESEFHGNGYCKPCGNAKSAKYRAKKKAAGGG